MFSDLDVKFDDFRFDQDNDALQLSKLIIKQWTTKKHSKVFIHQLTIGMKSIRLYMHRVVGRTGRIFSSLQGL